jgi:hypothetical protein
VFTAEFKRANIHRILKGESHGLGVFVCTTPVARRVSHEIGSEQLGTAGTGASGRSDGCAAQARRPHGRLLRDLLVRGELAQFVFALFSDDISH